MASAKPTIEAFSNRQFLNHPAAPHDRDLVAQAHHFLEFVCDQENSGAVLTQMAQHAKQLLSLLRSQHSGRFVQNQNPCATVQRLENFEALAVTRKSPTSVSNSTCKPVDTISVSSLLRTRGIQTGSTTNGVLPPASHFPAP